MTRIPRTMLRLIGLATLLSAGAVAAADDRQTVATEASFTYRPAPDTHDCGWVSYKALSHGTILFGMRVNGRPMQAMLDTGFGRSALDRGVIAPLAVIAGGEASVSGIGGQGIMNTAAPIDFEIGSSIEVRNLAAMVGDFAELSAAAEERIDLVVGMDVLGNGALEIDPMRHRFRICPPGASWAGALALPLRQSPGGMPSIEVQMLGSGPLVLGLDTGADGAIMLTAAAGARVALSGLRTTTIARQGTWGTLVSQLAIIPRLSFGTLALTDVALEIAEAKGVVADAGIDGVVGMELLGRFHTIFDFAAGRAFVQPDGPPPPDLRSTSGLQLRPRGAELEVVHVMANSPAAAAGWRAGNRLCAVDGILASNTGKESQTVDWLHGKVGRIVVVMMCDGSSRKLRLARFY